MLLVSTGQRAGGSPRAPLRAWVVEVDEVSGRVGRSLALPFDPSIASGADADDEATRAVLLSQRVVLQPTHTAVFWVCPDTWSVIDRSSHPGMASVHAAWEAADGGYAVACAANETVLRFDRSDGLVARHFLRDGPYPWAPDLDFRRLHHDALKPHSHHPNGVFEADGAWWATCFETREARTVDGSRRVALRGIPHDGAPQAGAWWFTGIEGWIEARRPDGSVVESLDLRALSGSRRMLGWCRGIAVIGRRAWVGMTQLRSTTHREVLRVLARGERGRKLPSRLVEVDLDERRIVREVPVGNAAGATIYGITHVPG